MSSKQASDKRAYPPPYDSLAAPFPESGFLLAYREQLRRTYLTDATRNPALSPAGETFRKMPHESKLTGHTQSLETVSCERHLSGALSFCRICMDVSSDVQQLQSFTRQHCKRVQFQRPRTKGSVGRG